MTKDTALKMAIEFIEMHLTTNDRTFIERTATLQACKEALEQQPQEPVAIVYSMQDGYIGQMVVKDIPHKTKLYTHPAPSWQGLSDGELSELLVSKGETSIKYLSFARAIEQALRNKNDAA